MALHFYLDANVIAKRYVPEIGTPVVNHLFQRVARDRLVCLALGTLEVVSIFVRKKNTQRISLATFRQALTDWENEILNAADFMKIKTPDAAIIGAMPFVDKHALNATDSLLLYSALDFASRLRALGDDLVLVTSDRRLLRATQAEGVSTFDPETQSEADLDTLLGP